MRIFISGGCKNGKSYYAQRLAVAQWALGATGAVEAGGQRNPGRAGQVHGQRSPGRAGQVQGPQSPGGAGQMHGLQSPGGARQLYYVATMLSGDEEDDARIARHRKEREGWGFATIEQPNAIEGILASCDWGGSFLLDSVTALLANEMFPRDGAQADDAGEKVAAGLLQVLRHVEDIVLVSDYIYNDAAFFDPLTEAYRRSLGAVDRALAQACDTVLEVVYTNVIIHKGSEAFDGLGQTIR